MVNQNYLATIVATTTQNPAEISEAIRLRYHLYKNREEPETVKLPAPKKRNSKNVTPRKRRISYNDGFDKFSTHIIVKETQSNTIVASVRLMDAFAAFELGGFFSEAEFDLGKLLNSAYLAEMSQLVIHPEYQNNAVFNALWTCVNAYCQDNRIDRVILNLAIPVTETGQEIQQIVNHTKSAQFTDSQFKVNPYQKLPSMDVLAIRSEIPFVLESCLNNGAKACGEAYWNKELQTADMLLQIYDFASDDSSQDKPFEQNVA